MKIEETEFEGIFKIFHKKFTDERGVFSELFRTEELRRYGFESVKQQNLSLSQKGTIRGLHYQSAPFEQSKIITVISGTIFDVVLDIRKESKTFSKYFTIKIDMDSDFSLLIGKGFAHGFQALEDETIILYSVDNIYNPECEKGINPLDNDYPIRWPCEKKILSSKDVSLPAFKLSRGGK